MDRIKIYFDDKIMDFIACACFCMLIVYGFFFEYFGASPWIQMAITRIWLPQVQNGHTAHVLLLVCLVKPQLPMHISILLRLSVMQNKIRTIFILMADHIFAACRFIFTDFNYSNWMTDSYIFKREHTHAYCESIAYC